MVALQTLQVRKNVFLDISAKSEWILAYDTAF